MGKRFRKSIRQIPVGKDSAEEDGNQIGEARSTQAGCINDQASDDDYFDEKYPSVDVKYKQLEDKLKAVEIQVVPGLDFNDLGLIYGVIIPRNSRY